MLPFDAGALVVNDHSGPVVTPEPLCATICQKYVVLFASAGGAYEAPACAADTCGGGFAVPNWTSKLVALGDVHVSVGVVVTPVARLAGEGEPGASGGGGGVTVVNDHSGPVVAPELLFATTCQKYVVLFASEGGVYEAPGCAVATCGGGFAVPNRTS